MFTKWIQLLARERELCKRVFNYYNITLFKRIKVGIDAFYIIFS